MCLSVVAKILELYEGEALAEIGNVKKKINLGILGNEIKIGDYVLIHTGFAIQIIDEKKAQEILDAYEGKITEEIE